MYYVWHRYYDPRTGRWITSDPIGLRGGLNTYVYVANNPLRWIDPNGLEIALQWHFVASDRYHTLLRVTPINQRRYLNDPRFSNIDSQGRRFASIGAGPEGGLLVSNINRSADRASHQNGIVINPPASCANEDEFIDRLFRLDSIYRDDLDYDLFPADPANRSWWIPDDSFNSNSYTAGLLRAAGIIPPQPPVNVPGWLQSVPIENFRVRTP